MAELNDYEAELLKLPEDEFFRILTLPRKEQIAALETLRNNGDNHADNTTSA